MSGRRSTVAGAVRIALWLLVGVLTCAEARAQPDGTVLEREFFLLGADRRPLVLAHGGIVPASFSLRVAGRSWILGTDYRLRARGGEVVPLRPWSSDGTAVAVAEYRYRPGLSSGRIGLRTMAPPPARDEAGRPVAPATQETWTLDDVGNLEVRGSKSVYVSSGTRQEMAVDQNLRLNVSGQLTRDIFVRATLTDDNLPVVPEGNTEELQDIDKVLVELQASHWNATLGDFEARRRGSLFGGYRRKLQGFSLEAYPGRLRAEALFGSPRGLYRTVELRGEESNQGPYFLGTNESSQNLFIVAGTERVTLDGEVLTRGSDRDYVIDYVRGTVTFTYRRLITADSIIVVEYEEGEGPYSRGVVGGGGGASFTLGEAPGQIMARLTREADDSSRLRSGELSPEDEDILRAAGDDELAAVAPGAVAVEPGEGEYDQVTDGAITYYVYNADGGDWTVAFFYAGPGLGDYDLSDLTETGVRVFTYVGPELGSYRVGRLLPLPESRSMFTVTADVGDSTGAGIHAEWNLSDHDQNTLSDRDADDNAGQAANVSLRTGAVGLAGGTLRADASWEDRDQDFAPFLLQKSVYDYERWGLGGRASAPGFLDEADRELGANLRWLAGQPGQLLEINGGLGRLDHGAALSAGRVDAGGRWEWLGGRGRHSWREATSEDAADPLDILRRDQSHDLRWRLGSVEPRGGYTRQSWFDDAFTGSAARGYRREELSAGLGIAPGRSWQADLGFTRGLADSLRGPRWEHVRDSRTWQGSLTSPRVAGLRAVVDGTWREVLLPGGGEETTRLGRLELAGTWPGLGSEWSLGYSLDNSRTEVLARQLVYVGELRGDYDENGNYVGPNRGDYDLLLAGTDSLVATTRVQSDLTWRQDFGFLGKDRLWGAWNAQTRLGVEARSRTDDIRGLLLLQRDVIFDDEDAVLGRVDLSQEVTLLRHLRAYDLRYRFDFLEAKDRQYAQGREDRLRREHTGTLTWNPGPRVSLRLRGFYSDDQRVTDAQLNPTQLGYLTITKRGELEGSWRPVAGSRAALTLEYLTRDDAVSGVSQRESAIKPAVRWRLGEEWSIQADVRVADVKSDEPAGSTRPFFFSIPGTNLENTARLSWDPSRYLTFALAYFGRKYGQREWQHDLRLESTARF